MRGSLRSAALAVTALLFAAGCALTGSGPGTQSDSRSADEPVTATVINDSYYNLSVFVGNDTRRDRLGRVSSFGSGTFQIPKSMVWQGGEIRLFADPVGDTFLYRSVPVVVKPGQVVEWTVKIDPAQTRGAIMVLNR